VLTAPPTFLDPVPGGFNYDPCATVGLAASSGQSVAYPFYYAPSSNQGDCWTTAAHEVNDASLLFFDQPRNPGLIANGYLGFDTTLVGVLPGGIPDLLSSLGDWFTWESNYTGSVGGVTFIALTASVPTDANDGSGGVTILSVAGQPVPEPSTGLLLITPLLFIFARVSLRRVSFDSFVARPASCPYPSNALLQAYVGRP